MATGGDVLGDLRKMRRDLGLSQESVAGEINITRSFLSQIETGERRPGTETAWALASFYAERCTGVDAENFYTRLTLRGVSA